MEPTIHQEDPFSPDDAFGEYIPDDIEVVDGDIDELQDAHAVETTADDQDEPLTHDEDDFGKVAEIEAEVEELQRDLAGHQSGSTAPSTANGGSSSTSSSQQSAVLDKQRMVRVVPRSLAEVPTTKLFIGGISPHSTNKSFRRLFDQFGSVR